MIWLCKDGKSSISLGNTARSSLYLKGIDSSMQYFYEKQRLNVGRTILIILILNTFIIGATIRFFELWRTGPMSEIDLYFILAVCLALVIGVTTIILGIQLETRVNRVGIRFRYLPFLRNWNTVRLTDIEEAYIGRCAARFGLGAWRYGYIDKKDQVYGIGGKEGVQFVLKNGARIFIGTRKVQELKKVLDKLMSKQKAKQYG